MSDQVENEDYNAKILNVFDQWEIQCDKAEKDFPGDAYLVWKINKTVKSNAKTVRVVPGVKGRIIQWGEKDNDAFPTVIRVDCKELRAYIVAARQAIKESQ